MRYTKKLVFASKEICGWSPFEKEVGVVCTFSSVNLFREREREREGL